jgi:flagellar basal-body rod protein FlgC
MAAVGGVSTVGSVSATAQSGLRAALLRLDVAANNLANLNTDGFVPAHVVGSDLAQGGVRSTLATDQRQREDGAPRESANRTPGDADPPGADGEFPPALLDDPATTSSVNPVAEIVNMLLAKAAFVASLRALQTDSVVSRHLMEVLG